MKSLLNLVGGVVIGAAILAPETGSGATVGFDQGVYSTTVGVPITLSVEISYLPTDLGSLFSFGLILDHSNAIANYAVNSVTVVPDLDNGPSGSAIISGVTNVPPLAPGAIREGAKGSVGLGNPVYTGTQLVSYSMVFNAPGSYPFGLETYFTIVPAGTEQVWVDGLGAELDTTITYTPTVVNVAVPEPSTAGLLLLAGLGAVIRRKRVVKSC